MIGGAGVRHFMNMRYLGEGKQLAPARGSRRRVAMGALRRGLLVISRIEKAPR